MNVRAGYENRSSMMLRREGVRAALALLLLLPVAAKAGGVVTNCTEADLRAAMAGGGTWIRREDATTHCISPRV